MSHSKPRNWSQEEEEASDPDFMGQSSNYATGECYLRKVWVPRKQTQRGAMPERKGEQGASTEPPTGVDSRDRAELKHHSEHQTHTRHS